MESENLYDEHNSAEITKFLESIKHRIPFYKYRIISYLLLKDYEKPRIVLGRVFYDYLPPSVNASFRFESRSLQAGVIVEEITRETSFDRFLVKPELCIDHTITSFKKFSNCHATVWRRPGDPDAMLTGNYVSQPSIALSCNDGNQFTFSHLQSLELKEELKVHESPYHDLNELLDRVGLRHLMQSSGDPIIEVVAAQVTHIIEPPAFDDRGCSVVLVAPAQIDISTIRLGFRVIGESIQRGLSTIEKDHDLPQEGAIKLAARVASDDAAYVQLFVSVKGDLMHQLWSTNLKKSLNLFSAVYRHIDNDLAVLKKLLFEPGNKSRDFELGITYLLELLGFHALHFGGLKRLENTVDLIAISPQRKMLLVECSTDIESAQSKLAKLVNRTSKIQEWLDSVGIKPESMQCAFVTTKAKHELVGDVVYAADHKIAMIYREDITAVVEGINGPQNPEDVFLRIVQTVPPAAGPQMAVDRLGM